MADQQINPNVYLGLEYNNYKSQVFAVALSAPTDYFKAKQVVNDTLKKNIIQGIYTTIYNALDELKDPDGDKILRTQPAPLSTISPKYPNQKIQQLALDASASIEKIMDEVVEILFPSDYNEILATKLNKIGKQQLI